MFCRLHFGTTALSWLNESPQIFSLREDISPGSTLHTVALVPAITFFWCNILDCWTVAGTKADEPVADPLGIKQIDLRVHQKTLVDDDLSAIAVSGMFTCPCSREKFTLKFMTCSRCDFHPP